MKKMIRITRIDIASLIKPLIMISLAIGFLVGIVMGTLFMPMSVVGAGSSLVMMIIGIMINTIGIAMIVIFVIILFNLICKMTGGIKIEIESEDDINE